MKVVRYVTGHYADGFDQTNLWGVGEREHVGVKMAVMLFGLGGALENHAFFAIFLNLT